MTEHVLSINDVSADQIPVKYTCFGLGSCVGVFITDRSKGVAGAAHIPLPAKTQGGDFQDAGKLLQLLLSNLNHMGSDLRGLRAKVAGGARIYPGDLNVGKENSEAVIKFLIHNHIYIAAVDVGGSDCRTARFDALTGELHISTSKHKTYSI